MFDSLSRKLSSIIETVKGKAIITEENLNETLREIRIALLEADVSLSVTKIFINNVKEKIIGQNILKNIKPDQMVIKLVHDELIEILGSKNSKIELSVKPPATILFCGLQGSGKTTSVAKIANLLKKEKKILLVSTDIYRPAAQEQLEVLSKQIGVDFFKLSNSKNIKDIVLQAIKKSKDEFYDILIIDTAGRQVINEEMMNELKIISEISNPSEKLLVADSLLGQESANIGLKFNNAINITGIILTRVDGDSRGGAALSIKSITGAPIKYIGIGEKIDQIEEFYPDRISKRILGMGDIITLVEKASESINNDELESIKDRFSKGNFNLNDFSKQLNQMKKMGGVNQVLSMLPGISKIQKNLANRSISDELINRQIAMINSMTYKERSSPEIIKASRKIRISKGSGTTVNEINKLLKQFLNSKKMMKKMKNMENKGLSMDMINKLKGLN